MSSLMQTATEMVGGVVLSPEWPRTSLTSSTGGRRSDEDRVRLVGDWGDHVSVRMRVVLALWTSLSPHLGMTERCGAFLTAWSTSVREASTMWVVVYVTGGVRLMA